MKRRVLTQWSMLAFAIAALGSTPAAACWGGCGYYGYYGAPSYAYYNPGYRYASLYGYRYGYGYRDYYGASYYGYGAGRGYVTAGYYYGRPYVRGPVYGWRGGYVRGGYYGGRVGRIGRRW